MTIVLDVIFAFTKSVPELDCPVAGARNDLTIIGREADGEDIGGVADKATGGVASVEVPQAQRVVPRGGEGELTIRGNDDVGYEVVVAVEDALGVTILILVAGELPDDDRLVYKKSGLLGLLTDCIAFQVTSDTRTRRKRWTYHETR